MSAYLFSSNIAVRVKPAFLHAIGPNTNTFWLAKNVLAGYLVRVHTTV